MEASEKTLDVTEIAPQFKHKRIFENFDNLEEGNTFVIWNDHDPKPLYYQMLAERGNTFSWEYLEEGPAWWKVRISRLTDEELLTVGEIAAKDLQKAAVFRKYGIDFCCGGKKTLKEACEEKKLDMKTVKNDLKKNSSISTQSLPRFQSWKLDFLIQYIIINHHKYVTNSGPEISKLFDTVVNVHADSHPELKEIRDIFLVLLQSLINHMRQEETVLFPYFISLENKKENEEDLNLKPSELVKLFEDEHYKTGTLLNKLNKLSNSYEPPEDGCASYKMLYKQLAEFDEDLRQHIHLENNILFPKVLLLLKNKPVD